MPYRLGFAGQLVKLGVSDYVNRKSGSETMSHKASLYTTPGGLAGGPTAMVSTVSNRHIGHVEVLKLAHVPAKSTMAIYF